MSQYTEDRLEDFKKKLEELTLYPEPFIINQYRKSSPIEEPFKAKLIEALLSGAYTQHIGDLCEIDKEDNIARHCVNGVCAEISGAKKEEVEYDLTKNILYDGDMYSYSNEYVTHETSVLLEFLNDKEYFTFETIASIIKEFL